jgi:hypothetical protein
MTDERAEKSTSGLDEITSAIIKKSIAIHICAASEISRRVVDQFRWGNIKRGTVPNS